MQNDDKPVMASKAKNPLSDEDIIEFAETVLADLDGSAVGQDEDEALVEDDDDIIDLTEVADKSERGDDILELTEDIDMGPSAEEGILELEDIAEKAVDEGDVAFELEDDIEALMLEDDTVIEVDDAVDEPADTIAKDATDEDDVADPFDMADEEETIDLSLTDRGDVVSPDREDEEADFDLESAAENVTQNSDESPLNSETSEEETLLEFEDRVSEENIAEGEPLKVSLETQPLGDQIEDQAEDPSEDQMTDGHQDKLKLTEWDRRKFEMELSLDIDDDASTDSTGSQDTAATDAGQSFDDTIDLSDPHLAEGAESADQRPQHDAVPSSPTLEEALPDFAEAASGGTPESFDFDFDETAEDDATAESESPMTPLTDDEELSVASLPTDSDATGNAEQQHPFDRAKRSPGADGAGPAEPSETEFDQDMQGTGASEMNFDSMESPDPHDGHTAAEAIAAQAMGLSSKYHADGDGPPDKSTEPIPETLSGEQLEAVVEQAVKKIFGEKIETMLIEAIEKAVTKEMERLKTLILGDLDHDR